ncbi:MAG: winged helix-turn-helix transcriptional regulator, partial [Thermoplasmata archaeon]|nr:winged helix-turn-helix transcriptional regulator [Thermoplasmata archaeon]NIS19525.1 winged helix-turn-helix transcriptional regulator [Thermoplasmata archaeon]NIT76658.1 winged helix-turn-helix transcriptional regulator [Thermoplasmata archaeon]NIU48641.1 winged helix-turn-helix transcriptional regulator [Thermoplasmata archaeon]NIY03029.1 winged helix-turn-helix transcriptional regulator [Thermoplasmata archaeon]
PGIHYQAIMKEFGLKNGVAAYHLDVLEREDYIRSVRDGRLKRFYSTDTKVPKDQRSTPEEVREEILQVVSEQPGISQKRIVNELGIDGETVRYHLRVLVEQGELRTGKEGRHAVYFRDT